MCQQKSPYDYSMACTYPPRSALVPACCCTLLCQPHCCLQRHLQHVHATMTTALPALTYFALPLSPLAAAMCSGSYCVPAALCATCAHIDLVLTAACPPPPLPPCQLHCVAAAPSTTCARRSRPMTTASSCTSATRTPSTTTSTRW